MNPGYFFNASTLVGLVSVHLQKKMWLGSGDTNLAYPHTSWVVLYLHPIHPNIFLT